jgi:hypothetical protein
MPRMDPHLREVVALAMLAAFGCGFALAQGSLLIRRYLCSRQRSNDYRSDTTFAMRNHRVANAGAKNRPPQRERAAKARKCR